MRKSLRSSLSFVLAFMIVFSTCIANFAIPASAAPPETVAMFDYGSQPAGAKPFAATGGTNQESAFLTTNATGTISYATGSVNSTGWESGADSKYWQISMPTTGYQNLVLTSASMRSSGTGPRDFKVTYSTDGITFNDVPGGTYTIASTSLTRLINNLSLPEDASQADMLYIRFMMTSNVSQGSGTVGAAGVSNINSIVVTGTPATVSGTVDQVEIMPDGGEIAVGQALVMSCPTEGAEIHYTINGGEEYIYNDASKPVINNLPATAMVYAKKSGMTDSKKVTFNYTQGTTADVTASPKSGKVNVGDTVTLKCATSGAVISYSVDGGAYQTYTAPISITTLPATVKAKAIADGLLTTREFTFNYTERTAQKYNTYFGQLHSHTSLSDGVGTVAQAFDYASKVSNLDFLAVTDHSNWFEGAGKPAVGTATLEDAKSNPSWLEGKKAAENINNAHVAKGDHNFLGLYAFEMTWSNGFGHINTFNTNGFENRDTAVYKTGAGPTTYYNKLTSNFNSISQFNHPGNTFGDFYDFDYYTAARDSVITMIEVGNGEGPVRQNGYFPSYEYYTRALDKGWHLAPTNNQDNHKGLWGDSNTARCVVLADELTEESLYDAMRNYRMYSTEDNALVIDYTLNGEVMGTILEDKPQEVNIRVEASSPNDTAIGKVEVIVNGGRVAATQNIAEKQGIVNFTLPADYTYYYIRITKPNKDIAVTAPVWLGETEKLGISGTTADTTLPIKDETFNITTDLYNNESSAMTVKSLVYEVNGQVIHTADLTNINTLNSLSTKSYTFPYTSITAGIVTINIKMTATLNGIEKTFTDTLKLNIADPSLVTRVLIDGTHNNDYVSGYYKNNMGNFTKIAADQQTQVKIEMTKITPEMLENTDLLIVSAPLKRADQLGNDGSSLIPKIFNDEFINLVADYVKNGGTAILCGIADYQDYAGAGLQSATQINKLLAAIGAGTRINSDELWDDDNNGGQEYRLYFNNVNTSSKWLTNVVPNQIYSSYSGCSVIPGSSAERLVNGHSTTYSVDSKNYGGGYVAQTKGDICALASEKVENGQIFVAGTVFMSDFEVKANLDNYGDSQYSNYTIILNVLNNVKRTLPISTVLQARGGNIGDSFSVEGIVTAGTAQSGNIFFDTVYIQDETGGINLFPVSDSGIEVGQKMRVTGTLDQYNNDIELKVSNYTVLNNAISPVAPTPLTAAAAMNYSTNGGKLVKIEGTVKSFFINNDMMESIIVNDGTGDARVFIDGYITSSDSTMEALEKTMVVGGKISVVGLVSADPDGTRIRVRDRAEIICTVSAARQQLEAEVAADALIEQGNYTDASYYTLYNKIVDAIVLLNNQAATDADCQAMISELQVAVNGLKTKSDYNLVLLKIAIDEANRIVTENDYPADVKPAVVNGLKASLSSAQLVYDDSGSTATAISNAKENLASWIQMLLFTANDTAIEAEIAHAKEIIASGKYADDAAMTAYKGALTEAEGILADVYSLQAEYDSTVTKLKDLEKNLHKVAALNYDTLKQEIAVADALNLTKYLDTGKDTFKTALAAAKALIDNAQTQQQIDDATISLFTARLALRLIPDKSALKSLIESTQSMGLSGYTLSSGDDLRSALSAALLVYNNPQATQGEVNGAVALINAAKNKLVPLGTDKSTSSTDKSTSSTDTSTDIDSLDVSKSKGSDEEVDDYSDEEVGDYSGEDTSDSPETGDNNSIALFVIFGLSASALIIASLKKKKTNQ